ncbi:MAG: dTDP-4-dehydrorhamnose 3,5-epimerase [Fibrobacter sp.]|jgi:dTDP-4-dehydrorhamnose 3,5-epimerase|nr:dTDP-4-dehydrorhamnose 3,5-epimerase [Fibrobacter sp.]
MGKFKFIETPLKDAFLVEPAVFGDHRGYFSETYNERDFAEFGIQVKFVQDNESFSSAGVLRGLHFQKKNPQAKLVRVTHGNVFDAAVDLRKDSPTFGKWFGVLLTSENHRQFYIPEGFAHGFLVLSETAGFVYKCSRFYDPSDEGGILWNDPVLNIRWPLEEIERTLISEKDLKNPKWNDIGFFF